VDKVSIKEYCNHVISGVVPARELVMGHRLAGLTPLDELCLGLTQKQLLSESRRSIINRCLVIRYVRRSGYFQMP
jgi:hypothetical protein